MQLPQKTHPFLLHLTQHGGAIIWMWSAIEALCANSRTLFYVFWQRGEGVRVAGQCRNSWYRQIPIKLHCLSSMWQIFSEFTQYWCFNTCKLFRDTNCGLDAFTVFIFPADFPGLNAACKVLPQSRLCVLTKVVMCNVQIFTFRLVRTLLPFGGLCYSPSR